MPNHFFKIIFTLILVLSIAGLNHGQIQKRIGTSASGRLHNIIECGDENSFRIENGSLWSWGNNEYGELGIGLNVFKTNVPHRVKGINGNGFLTNAIAVSGGDEYHTLILLSDGRVAACGRNYQGQLGNPLGFNSSSNQYVPLYVQSSSNNNEFLENVVDISAGTYHSMALKVDGTVWTWGEDSAGILGQGGQWEGPDIKTYIPAKAVGLTNICSIKASDLHNLALSADGTVWAWGQNVLCQLGVGTTNQGTNIAVKVVGLSNCSAPG